MTPRGKGLFVVAALAAAALLVAGLSPHLVPTGDQATFVLLGRAIASGEGYADAFRPDAPPHTKFPPLLPLLVAPIAARDIEARSFVLSQSIVLAIAVLGAGFAYVFFRPSGKGVAALLAALLLFNARFYASSHTLMSDVPFITASLAALVALRAAARSERVLSRAAIAAGAALAAAVLFRTVGAALAVAGALFLLLGVESRGEVPFRIRKAAVVLFPPVATLAAWLLRNNVVAGRSTEYLRQIGAANPEDAAAGALTPGGFADRIWSAFYDYFFQSGDLLFLRAEAVGLVPALEVPALFVLAVAVGAIVAAYIPLLISGRGPAELWVLLYVGALVVYPYRSWRYALPLLPFLLHYLWIGLGRLVSPMAWKAASRAAVLGGFAAANLAAIGVFLAEGDRREFGGHRIAGVSAEDFYLGGYGELFRAARWARENVPEDAVVFTDKAEYVALWSGRKTIPYPGFREPERILEDALARRADVLLTDDLTKRDLGRRPDLLAPHFAEARRFGRTIVWERR